MRKNVISFILYLLVNLGILFLSLIPLHQQLGQVDNGDKIMHMIAYIVLGASTFLLLISLDHMKGCSNLRCFLLAVLYCAILGGSIELIQPYVGRGRELLDFIADIIGAMIGAGILLPFARRLRN